MTTREVEANGKRYQINSTTVGDLIKILKRYDKDLFIDVRYDSGHGHGDIDAKSLSIEDGMLRIDVS